MGNPNQPDQLFYSVSWFAAAANLDQRTVRKAIKDGDIPAVRIGRSFRIPAAWVREQMGNAA